MSTDIATPTRGLYARLWREVPGALAYLLPTLFIVLAGTITTSVLLSMAAGLLAVVVGIVFVLAALVVSSGFASLERLRLRVTGRTIPAPRRPAPRPGLRGFLAPLGDAHRWLELVHTLIVAPLVGILTWSITIGWLALTLGGLTFWAWSNDGGNGAVLIILAGVAGAALLPFVLRGLVVVHSAIAQGMLGPFRREELEGRVTQLTESRTAAASAEGGALRRLERDLHDGPQQRLVRLQMDLSSALRRMDDDPARARELLEAARVQSADALEELRALSRGFAPPLLLDRGLRAALDALAGRSTVPARFVDELPEHVEIPVEIERNLYFVAAEALTNAAKHSAATSAEVRIAARRIPDTDVTWVELVIRDDGSGGASAREGHGIAGLDERMRGMGGILSVVSPVGGPTTVDAQVPLVR